MTEWSNVTVLKTVVRLCVPWVRIPLSPFYSKSFTRIFKYDKEIYLIKQIILTATLNVVPFYFELGFKNVKEINFH